MLPVAVESGCRRVVFLSKCLLYGQLIEEGKADIVSGAVVAAIEITQSCNQLYVHSLFSGILFIFCVFAVKVFAVILSGFCVDRGLVVITFFLDFR